MNKIKEIEWDMMMRSCRLEPSSLMKRESDYPHPSLPLPHSIPPFLLTCVSDKAGVDEAIVVVHALREVNLVQHGGGLLDDHL